MVAYDQRDTNTYTVVVRTMEGAKCREWRGEGGEEQDIPVHNFGGEYGVPRTEGNKFL